MSYSPVCVCVNTTNNSYSALSCMTTTSQRRLPFIFCSLAVLDPRVGHTMDVLSPFISVLCHYDSSMGSPVHVLMLSIHAVCGLPSLRALGIVPCIISFSRQLPSSPTPRDLAVTSRLRKPTAYPRPSLRTKRYYSAVSYALLNFQ